MVRPPDYSLTMVDDDLIVKASAVMDHNSRQANYHGRIYRYTVPSQNHYPFQWFWDSCFHAIIYTRLNLPERAKSEIDCLFLRQRENGFMPHIQFWDKSKLKIRLHSWKWLETRPFLSFLPFSPKPSTSEEIQPPILAQAIEEVYKKTGDLVWLKTVLQKTERYYHWFSDNRTVDSGGLIVIIAPFESGLDQSPAYDPVISDRVLTPNQSLHITRQLAFSNKLLLYNNFLIKRFGRFLVKDVLVNTLYIQGLQSLGRLYGYAGVIGKEDFFRKWSERVQGSLIKECWDKEAGLFWNVDVRKNRYSKLKTVISLMPIVLETLPGETADRLVSDHFLNSDEFYLPYPIPSVAKDEPSFRASDNHPADLTRPLWRGSTWVNTNWMIIGGLRRHGYFKLADKIAEKTRYLVKKHGFWEYYNPIDGKPGELAARNFSWSTLACCMS